MSDIESKYGEPDEVRSRLAMFMAAALEKKGRIDELADIAGDQADFLECSFRKLYDAWEGE